MSETLSRDVLDRTAGELADLLAARKIGALELMDAAIARIEDRDRALNAVVVRDFDRARDAAKAADAALARGERRPLLGLPMTVKESNQVEGLPSTWGSPAFSGWTAPRDAVVIQKLKAAGAIVMGLTNVPPFLADWQATNPVYGRTRNPWDLSRSPGGSSGGSAAALASGMTPLEIGSDIGGSIRVPSAFCGTYGHKPTYGLVSSRGHSPPGLDGGPVPLAVVGPMARAPADLRRALDVIAGPEAHDAKGYVLDLPEPRRAELADYRILVLSSHPLAATDSEVAGALETLADRLDALGAAVFRSSELMPDLAAQHQVYMPILNTAISRGQPGATPIDAHTYMNMLDAQVGFQRAWAAFFETFDVVIMPTFGTTAFPHVDESSMPARTLTIDGRSTPYFDQLAWPAVALLPNLPATAVPIGFSRAGLPIGAQIMGAHLEDRTTIHVAELLEREFGGFRPPPPLT
ncbi:MAG: hypothetical protein JNK30_15910 [Phenylobacterium sp.]|uniref:amidase family protein n=1 Tax=Phenylobacterium sp. TaxID=1871053 RepID=UPI001A608C67|nr:amidase family protein [Phenylobacterium sp.]MBL8772867.1 hypothetical protein [Phenylobacterium sp.]